ncbi:hypothetical protein TW95_gp0259 [Pandoravirus inopinatum]|uniref:Transmembrane protein n=1 Tax=Pandoravirus inopinatum TaxID=1605721 RepID=A0A0B5IWC0_9VIRU|nr:hypothetical protein TW95_gp0259 [Pandoravirus inopinatum]AJF96993.1 hypothetical protein [Pandoravirus inopinatum]
MSPFAVRTGRRVVVDVIGCAKSERDWFPVVPWCVPFFVVACVSFLVPVNSGGPQTKKGLGARWKRKDRAPFFSHPARQRAAKCFGHLFFLFGKKKGRGQGKTKRSAAMQASHVRGALAKPEPGGHATFLPP